MGLTPSDANSYYAEARSQTGYRNNDSNTIDKAITTCDKTEFEPQDISYIRKAIGTLKAANSYWE